MLIYILTCVYAHTHLYRVSLFLNSGVNMVEFVQNKVILEVLRNLQPEKEACEPCLHFLGSLNSLKCFYLFPSFLLRLYNHVAQGDRTGSL